MNGKGATIMTKTKLIAYHNDPKLKARTVATMRKHRKMDTLIRGSYWTQGGDGVFRGCAVGCLIHSDSHSEYEPRFGIPTALALLEDSMFEDLPLDQAMEWPVRFLSAIRAGADLSNVAARFTVRVLKNLTYDRAKYPKMEEAVLVLVALLARRIAGEEPTAAEWRNAANAAYAADNSAYAAYAADNAANAVYAAYAADNAANAAYAANAAVYAAYAADNAANAAYAADANAARSSHWSKMADWLIEEIKAAPVSEAAA